MAAETYGQRVRMLRDRLKMSQREVADIIGCTRSMVASVEGERWRFGRSVEPKFVRLAGVGREFIADAPLKSADAA
jgi:transcriptional regulator with XRE-family HTH domain